MSPCSDNSDSPSPLAPMTQSVSVSSPSLQQQQQQQEASSLVQQEAPSQPVAQQQTSVSLQQQQQQSQQSASHLQQAQPAISLSKSPPMQSPPTQHSLPHPFHQNSSQESPTPISTGHVSQQPLQIHTASSNHSHQPSSGTPKSVAVPTSAKSISGDDIPPMHAIRVSSKGFRQRWNGQQWRRLCDEPTCLREAQRLSLCAKHQPIKDWRPSRRSVPSAAKKASPKRGQRRSHPVDFQTALAMPGVAPHSMPIPDPSLFPVDAATLQMPGGEHEDHLGAPIHGWPQMAGVPGYAPMPSGYPQQGYPYENPALLHLAAEQMAAAWSMQQPPPSHMPSQFIR